MFQMFLNVSRLFLALRNLGICLTGFEEGKHFFPPSGIPQHSPGLTSHRKKEKSQLPHVQSLQITQLDQCI